jgi:hypothetical protein
MSEENNEVWRELCAAAVAFRDLAAWRWMNDAQNFGVADPASGQIGYCTVMGQLGEFLALGVYRGPEGYAVLKAINDRTLRPGNPEALFRQNALIASFEDREDLDARDRALLKSAGVKARGRNAWPCFRSYLPGYAPWYLTEPEAGVLRAALEQAALIGARLREEPGLLQPPRPGQILVRVPERQGGDWAWRDEWQPCPTPPAPAPAPRPQIDGERLAALAGSLERAPMSWEYDFTFMPAPIAGDESTGGRPYFPRMGLCVDRKSGRIIDIGMAPPEGYADVLANRLIEVIQQLGGMPEQFLVARPEAQSLLEPLAQALGISVHLERRLPALEEALASLGAYLQRG